MAENDRFSEETELMKSPCVASELTLRVDVVAQTFGVLGIGKWGNTKTAVIDVEEQIKFRQGGARLLFRGACVTR
jgi:hypothetical protein